MVLFDANLLIAMADHDHEHHDAAIAFQAKVRPDGWVTCPLTENAFLRIVGHPSYPKGPGSPNAARELLKGMTSQPGHLFWPDSISLCDLRSYPTLPSSKNLTDYYLLALAVRKRAMLATFDRRIDPSLLEGGPDAYQVIGKDA
jgi:hypothetical protein